MSVIYHVSMSCNTLLDCVFVIIIILLNPTLLHGVRSVSPIKSGTMAFFQILPPEKTV